MKRLVLSLSACALLVVIGCQKDEVQADDFTNQSQQQELAGAEEAAPNVTGEVTEAYIDGRKYVGEIIDINGEEFFLQEGDILTPMKFVTFELPNLVLEPGASADTASKSVGTSQKSKFWPDNKVYYTVSSSLPNQKRVTDAIAHWEQKTALRFFKRTNQRNYITFITGSGCSSSVGMIGNQQYIRLSNGCSTGSTIHEIGHAVGLQHEQTRTDRDNYVRILTQNITSGKEHNFRKSSTSFNKDYTKTMDFGSIMMYSSKAFSKNGQPTIQKLDGSSYSTQRNGLSNADITGINVMYPAKTTNPNPTPNPTPDYVNGQTYTIYGVKVGRYFNKWWYYNPDRTPSNNGWHEVELRNTTWYYAN